MRNRTLAGAVSTFGFTWILVSFTLVESVAYPGESLALPFAGRQPRGAVLQDSRCAVAYGAEGNIYVTFINAPGTTCSLPVHVAQLDGLMLGMRRGPQIAATSTSLVIAACGKSGNLLSWSSTDAGSSWRGPFPVNDSPASAKEGLSSLASSPAGGLYAVWLDARSDGHRVFGSASSDGGQTWQGNVCIYQSPNGTVCECCQPQVAFRNDGDICVMWRNWLGGSRDMYEAESTDGGPNFTPAVKLGRGTWPLRACPMDGGTICAPADTTFTAVWRRDQKLFVTSGHGDEQSLSEGRNPSAVFANRKTYTAWQTMNDVVMLKAGSDAPVALGDGKFPVLCRGSADAVFATWESNGRPVVARIN